MVYFFPRLAARPLTYALAMKILSVKRRLYRTEPSASKAGAVTEPDAEANQGPVRLRRHLGVIHGVAIICGLVIGSGIFVTPQGVLIGTNSPGLALVFWIAGGGFATLGALTIAEMGTTFPASGEKYEYFHQMFGPFVAFMYLWAYTLMFRVGSNVIKGLTFASYVLKPVYPDCEIPAELVVLLGVLLSSMSP